jgi:redox-sensitive bicupin YhaK (pirin superfamily)
MRHVGDEAQPALVDAHQRQVVARQLARDAEHGAVAAHHHRQVAVLAHLVDGQGVEVGDAGGWRGVALERDLQALAHQEMGDLLQQRRMPRPGICRRCAA